ncbi:MAG: HlyD family type I secretion periplasmic adaptor subunit [Burkholderiales bacterium]
MRADHEQHVTSYLDLDQGPKRAAIALVGVIGALLLFAFVWMAFSKLEITVEASGKVIPSRRVQQIQSLEGGIVREIHVREGVQIHKGDLLVTLENKQFNASLGESQESYWGQQAALARLNAEISGTHPVFPKDVVAHVPDQVRREMQLWSSRQSEQSALLAVAQRQIDQRRQELGETHGRIRSLKQNMGIAEQQLEIEERLLAKGAGTRGQQLAAQQEVSRIQGDLRAAELAIPRLEAAIREAEAKGAETKAKIVTEASTQRNELQVKLAALSQKMTGDEDKVSRHAIRAPMEGIVNRMMLTTEGGVAKPGETLMEIIPVEDELLIAAQVKPKDIAFLRAEQKAKVRVSAYDFSVYGSLDAKVSRVGADAVLDPKQENLYFEVHLVTDRNYLGTPEQHLRILPGMTVDARITTGERSVLEYLFKPVTKVLSGALQER